MRQPTQMMPFAYRFLSKSRLINELSHQKNSLSLASAPPLILSSKW